MISEKEQIKLDIRELDITLTESIWPPTSVTILFRVREFVHSPVYQKSNLELG